MIKERNAFQQINNQAGRCRLRLERIARNPHKLPKFVTFGLLKAKSKCRLVFKQLFFICTKNIVPHPTPACRNKLKSFTDRIFQVSIDKHFTNIKPSFRAWPDGITPTPFAQVAQISPICPLNLFTLTMKNRTAQI